MKQKFFFNLVKYNKEEFKKLHTIIFLSVFFSCVYFLFQNKQENVPKSILKVSAPETLIAKEKELLTLLEGNFLNPYLIDSVIDNHYQIPKYWKNRKEMVMIRDEYGLFNFFMERKNAYDKQYVEMANFALGILNVRLDSVERAQKYLVSLSDEVYPFLDYYKGIMLLNSGDVTGGEKYLISAINTNNKYQDKAKEILLKFYLRHEWYKKINILFSYKDVASVLNHDQVIKVYFKEYHPIYHTYALHKKYFYDVKILYVLGSLLITLCWLYYLNKIDLFNVFKTGYGITAIFLGILAVYLNIIVHSLTAPLQQYIQPNSFIYYFIFAGVVEEVLKLACVLICLLIFKTKANNLSVILFAGCYVALGFSFLENIIHFQRNFEEGLFVRCMTAVPGHIINTSIVCYAFVLKKSVLKTRPLAFILGPLLFCSAFLHGVYNYLAVLNIFSLFVLLLIITFNLWVIIINNTLNNSKEFTYHGITGLYKMRYIFFTFLMFVFCLQQIAIFSNYPTSDFSLQRYGVLLFSVLAIYFVSWKLSNIDLVKNYLFSYFSISNSAKDGQQSALLQYSSQLMVGSIIPHNIVYKNCQIKFSEDDFNIYDGKITSRIVVSNQAGKMNPYWFKISIDGMDGGFINNEYVFYFAKEAPVIERRSVHKILLFKVVDTNLKTDLLQCSDIIFYKKAEMLLV